MNLALQKRIAAKILKCSEDRVWFNPSSLEDIKEAITRQDIRLLIKKGAIKKKQKKGISKVRSKKKKLQKKKGRQKGHGSRKGKKTARLPKKEAWMMKIRAQRKVLRMLKEKNLLDEKTYRRLYRKATGGVFRSKKHLMLYINDHNLAIRELKIEDIKESKKSNGTKNLERKKRDKK